jgi:DNA-binding SARP family transcriptional activator
MLEIRVLGPLEAWSDGVALRLGTPKQQAVLGALALNHGHTVPVDDLVDELWPHRPPASAVANVRTYAANLRRLLSAAAGAEPIVRLRAGYRLDVTPDQLDLLRFAGDRAAAEAAYAAGDLATAVARLERAYALGRGPALAGLDHGIRSAARCQALDEDQAAVAERLADVRLALGEPVAAVTLLGPHVRRNPLRERGHALLVRAHRDAGEPAEALAAYETARASLAGELGVEPGPELRHLRDELRDGGPAVARSWLPRPVADFTGREDVVRRLTDPRGPATVWLIDGMAGVGKTTLAVHAARTAQPRYPDAQLFIDLRGHDEGEPVTPLAALATLLRQLGVPGTRVPADLEGRSALWRQELAARRCVVVLDNAGDTEQVAPLLPADPGSLFVVTSRRRLLGASGVRLESLPLLDRSEAVDLLGKVAGPDRVAAEPEAAAELARLCGDLPLALRLAGARLAHRAGWRVADLVERLTVESAVLTELSDEDRTVAAVFSTSYERLTPDAQRAFRLLGLTAAADVTVPVVAALTGWDRRTAGRVLDELVDRHLVQEPEAGRFRLHDLLRVYAASLVASEPPADQREHLTDLYDHYLSVAIAVVLPERGEFVTRYLAGHVPRRPELVPAGVGPDWLQRERLNLVGAVRQAAEQGAHQYAWQLALVMWRQLYERGLYEDVVATHGSALAACEKAGDRRGAAVAHNYLASVHEVTGQLDAAERHVTTANKLFGAIGDELGQYISRANLGAVYVQTWRVRDAIDILTDLGSFRGEASRTVARRLGNLAAAYVTVGDLDRALILYRRFLFAARADGDGRQVLRALAHVGKVRELRGEIGPAARLLHTAIALKLRDGSDYGLGEAYNDLGRVYRLSGRLAEAEEHHRTALRLVGELGHACRKVEVLTDLGTTLHAAGDPGARGYHAQALDLATTMGYANLQARALVGLAECVRHHHPAAARRYLERALDIFVRMDIPTRHEVARQLDDLRERPLAAAS